MLYLNPPFYVIEGVSLFPDHADPLQFYYLPLYPHIATPIDAATKQPSPTIRLWCYRSAVNAPTNGALLEFDVNLALPMSTDDLARELKSAAKLTGTPRIVPVQVVDGKVQLFAMGSVSVDPTAPKPPPGTPPPPPGNFVQQILAAGKPSLYGDEQATFSVQLDQYGAKLASDALTGSNMAPLAVVYQLDFLALRPAYHIKVSVDWNRVQHHLDESFHVDVTFFSSDIDKVIDKLTEDQSIHVDEQSYFDEADPANKDLAARRDGAVAQAKELIKNTFFQSSIPPPQSGPDDAAKAEGVANKVSQLLFTGGASSLASFSYRKVDMTRIDQKSLNATFDEETTVRQTVFPQGHLVGMFSLATGALTPAQIEQQFVKYIDLDDPYFQKRTITAISRADFSGDHIAAIDVAMTYNGQTQNLTIESTTDQQRGVKTWSSKLDANKQMIRDATYSYKVTFAGVDRSQRPVELDTAKLGIALTTTEDAIEIIPRDLLYSISEVPIAALGSFPWDRYPQVEVECRYADAANQIALDRTFQLTQTAASATFELFMRDPTKRTFQSKITYHAADGTGYSPGWATNTDEQVMVNDPFPRAVQLTVIAPMDWSTIDHVYVDLDYEADDVEATFDFSEKSSGPQTFTAHPTDPTNKLVSYVVTIIAKGGATTTVPKSYTADKRVIVRTDMRGHRVIAVTGDGKPFKGTHAVSIDVDLRYVDTAHGLTETEHVTLKSPTDKGLFEFDYVDASRTAYEYMTTTHYDDGTTSKTNWTTANDTTLAIAPQAN